MKIPSKHASPLVPALLLLAALARTTMAGNLDSQFWSELKLTAKWGEHFDLIAASTLRLGESMSRLDRTSGLFGVNYRATERLTLTPSYQYIVNDPADDVRDFEHRIGLVLAYRLPVERFETTFSTGIEYRSRHGQEDGWRVRPRIKLKRPFGPEHWGLAGYVADELFYDTREADWTRNRLFIGLEKKMRRNWVFDLYYCRQHDLRTRDPDLNIFGLSMRLSLDHSASDSRLDLHID